MLRKRENQRSLAVLLIFILTVTIGYCILFEGINLVHDCSGSDCPVCQELHSAQSMTKQLLAGVALYAAGIYLRITALDAEILELCLISRRTLILDKVRIDA